MLFRSGSVLPGILIIIMAAHGWLTWQLFQRVVHLEQQLGIRSSSVIPSVRVPCIKKPELPRVAIDDWQIQLDKATSHVERARVAITNGNMGIARDESAKALETLTRISRIPAVDPDALAAIRRQIATIESQIKGSGANPHKSEGTSK